MPLVCAQCSRVNPADASYCYFDGAALAGRAGGPLNPGAALFPSPFVFPGGQSCRNFDQLAVTCQQDWKGGIEMLKKGFLGSFFGGIGRVDLAVAAQEAANFPDADRGLDQLLSKLPTQVLEAPKLQVEPTVINLGECRVGTDKASEIHLTNLGMRLVYGSVASDCKWLTLGDAPGLAQKLFQFGSDTVIAVQVRGQHLRAGTKPLEGTLAVESNAGSFTVTLRADVPVTPYAGGLFAGAVTPRQIAEKAKANPKVAAAYFEDGTVANWFKSNGWTYPVQGPAMSGMGAVQQFFEALGVAKPPKVEINATVIELTGEPGQSLKASIEVTSPERKVVYGWATADKNWVEFGKTQLSGRAAVIPITVPSVPNRKGTLQANLTVVGNGNQKFIVPLRLAVIGGADEPEETEMLEVFDGEMIPGDATAAFEVVEETAVTAAAPPPTLTVPVPMPIPAPSRPPSEPSFTLPASSPNISLAPSTATAESSFMELEPTVGLPPSLAARQSRPKPLLHLVPLALLAVTLFVVILRDVIVGLFFGGAAAEGDIDPRPVLKLSVDYGFDKKEKGFTDTLSFGLAGVESSEHGNADKKMRLIYGPRGHTNSVVLKIDNKEAIFGDRRFGRWKDVTELTKDGYGVRGTFEFTKEGIFVTQEVKLIPGEPIEVQPEKFRRRYDTCLVTYTIENKANHAHDVGLRSLLDTYIGDNDGAPFYIDSGLVDTFKEFKGKQDIPYSIQVLENPDLKNPGLIAQLNLRLGAHYEVPERVLLTQHPYQQNLDPTAKDHWEIPLVPIRNEEKGDSCVVMYWDPIRLGPGARRTMGYTYGLGNVSASPDAKLGLSIGGSQLVDGEMIVTALVADPKAREVRLSLPPEMKIVGNAANPQKVPELQKYTDRKTGASAYRPEPVMWRVRATKTGQYPIEVRTDTGLTQVQRVQIRQAKLL